MDQFGIRVYLWYIGFMPIKDVNDSGMCTKIRTMPQLRNIHNLQLLTLYWHSYSGCGWEHVAVIFAPDGCQYVIHGCLQPIGGSITYDSQCTSIDAELMVITRMGRWPCCCLFCQWMMRIHRLYIIATRSPFIYHSYKTGNHWLSVVVHSGNGVENVLRCRLPFNAAIPSVMHNSYLITDQLLYVQDHKSLNLRWCPFSEWGSDRVAVSFAFRSSQFLGWEWQRPDHCSISHDEIFYILPKIPSACYTSVSQPIFTSYCSPFGHNIYLTQSPTQDTFRRWWNIYAFCPTCSSLPYSSSFLLHEPSPRPCQPVLVTYGLA